MTVDDSTIVTQAVSSTNKRFRRIIHGSVGERTVYLIFVLSNVISALAQADQAAPASLPRSSRNIFLARNWAASRFDPTSYLGAQVTSFILRSVVLPYLISIQLKRNAINTKPISAWPSMAATTITALIPLLSSALSSAGMEAVTNGQMVMITLSGLLRFDVLPEQTLAFTLLALTDRLSATWCYFNGILNMVRYAQKNDKTSDSRAVKSNQLLEYGGNTGDIHQIISEMCNSVSRLLSSWPRSQRIMTLMFIIYGQISVLVQVISHLSKSGKAPTPNFTTAEQVIPQRFLLVTAIMLPVLFNNGLGRTMKGATGFGLRSLYGLCYTIPFAGLSIYKAWKGDNAITITSYLSTALAKSSTLVSTWIWWYKIKSSVTLSYAILMTATIFASAGITSALDIDSVTLAIPLILYRIYLAGRPPTPRPYAEEEKEKRKPDPQKGLTATEERDVNVVLEFGWYLLLTTIWTAYKA